MGPSTSLRLFRHCRTAHPADINPQNGVLNPPHHIICTFDFFTCSTISKNVASFRLSSSLFISMKTDFRTMNTNNKSHASMFHPLIKLLKNDKMA